VCEFDPCNSGPAPTSLELETRARQQITSYNCGPATGQVVVNYSRGVIFTNKTASGAEDPAINWKKQSKIAEYMGTTTAGTGGADLAAGLNNPNAVLRPVPNWIYSYANTGSKQNFHNLVVTDIYNYEMPLVLATAPHQSGAGSNFLESWQTIQHGSHHWITIQGYNGLYGSAFPSMLYHDSSAGYGGSTGSFEDLVSVLWQVNDWNQGGHIVW
jgi:hypothetical protein